jgi:hypothetical protein
LQGLSFLGSAGCDFTVQQVIGRILLDENSSDLSQVLLLTHYAQ